MSEFKRLLSSPIGKLALNAALTGKAPTHQQWVEACPVFKHGFSYDFDMECLRAPFTKFFSWHIPTKELVEEIISYGKVAEVMAGEGYLANLIAGAGGTIRATDNGAWDYTGKWFTIEKSEAAIAAHVQDYQILVVAWPHYSQSDGGLLKHIHSGQHLCFIGEGDGGCTGTPDFHETLSIDFEYIKTIAIPQWPGLHDDATFWRKK